MYCSFCLSPQTNIEDLDLNAWEARDSATVWAEAKEWLNTMTQTGQAAQEAISGVRWTSMHHLPYWDPVKHTILGFMHNQIEGVMKNHLHTLWGIEWDEKEEQKLGAVEVVEQ